MRSLIYLLKKYTLVWIWPIILTTTYPTTIPTDTNSATSDTVLIKETQQTLPNTCEDADEMDQKGPLYNTTSTNKDSNPGIVECMVKGLTLPLLEWGMHYIYN